MVRNSIRFIVLTLLLLAGPLTAQPPARDPSDRLREVLPPEIAARVLASIAEARAHELPAHALEQRALKFAAKGVDPRSIEKSVADQAERMESAKQALESGRGRKANDDEVDAGGEAIRRGVAVGQLKELAATAPSGRSLSVPLYVIGSLIDRGLPSDDALRRVLERLEARASDAELEKLPTSLGPPGQADKNKLTGQDLAATKRPETTGNARGNGPPAGVPGNAGKDTRATPPGRSDTPPGRRGGRGG
jgi:hypothetical protein